jgi:hypothetical protein
MFGQSVYYAEADVMTCFVVFRARISKSYNNTHRLSQRGIGAISN